MPDYSQIPNDRLFDTIPDYIFARPDCKVTWDVRVFPMCNSGLGWERSIEEDFTRSFETKAEAIDFANQHRASHDRADIWRIERDGQGNVINCDLAS